MGTSASSGEVQLVRPSVRYRDSVLAAVREFQTEGGYSAYSLARLTSDFAAFVQHLLDDEDRSKLPPHLVPQTIYWLVEGDEFIGRASLRHELNDQLRLIGGHIGYEIRPSKRLMGYGKMILRLGLIEAKKVGITRALVTCDDTNIGSAKIIEANGGVMENIVLLAGRSVPTRRYWIELE